MPAAVQIYRQLIAIAPDIADLHALLGTALQASGQGAQAQQSLRRAVALAPHAASTHVALGMSLLSQGDYPEGWREYEWRWQGEPGLRHAGGAVTRWQGENAPGKTLLAWAEQGLGDTLQFCRLTKLARQRGLRVRLGVPLPLRRLLADAEGLGEIIPTDHFHGDFDFHCPLLSLPLALGMAGPEIQGPYLRADPTRQRVWHRRLQPHCGTGLRVGIAWAGRSTMILDRRRSLPPSALASLAEIGNVHLVSLQKDGAAAPPPLRLVDLTAAFKDFADTAALIANLDLVVSVDTAVAHLAAGMGKPTWLLDRFDHCWRWLAGRATSPWYPSMRIMRQSTPGDWTAVIESLTTDLRQIGASRTAV